MFTVMMLEEEFIFRRHGRGFDWTAWNRPRDLPIGVAGLIAFCIGWVGSVLSMYETYFTGPIGKMVGEGIDLGFPVGGSWAGLVYPPLRWLELKYLGR